MIKSMTGYGRGDSKREDLHFSVEIKAVNHRYCDVNIKAPRLLSALEPELKKRVQGHLKRGKIDVYISQDNSSRLTAVPVVAEDLALAYMKAFGRLQELSGLSGSVSVEFLAAQKDVLQVQDAELSMDDVRTCLFEALDHALEAISVMRKCEGEATAVDIQDRLSSLGEILAAIEEVAPRVPLEWQEKLNERLAKLQDNGGDPQRIAQEIAIFADRCDISEEITRFKSHLQQFTELLQGDEPVGRQMDFLVQELNREANTMGSKSNDAVLTRQVVALKSELEKIREQVQNIE